MRFADHHPVPAAWLAVAGDDEAVADALRAADPELGRRLVRCRSKRFRLDGAESCTGTYVLTLHRPGGGDEETVVNAVAYAPERLPAAPVATGSFGEPGWTVRLTRLGIDVRCAPAEVALAAYDELLDPGRAPAVLTEVLRTGTRADDGLVVRRADIDVLRYKPGSRCTFRVAVQADGRGADDLPPVIIAKTHAGDKGAVADRSMRALWSSPLRHGSVAIAEPLGFDPARKILLQGPIPEEITLKELLKRWFGGDRSTPWDRLVELVRRTGVGLGELHTCGVRIGDPVGITDELDEVHRRAGRVAGAFPDHGPMLLAITDQLDELATASQPEPSRPAHRSFRPAQVLIAGDGMGFIDFDGFCQAEPAMDVGLFTAMVRSIGLNKGVEDRELVDMAADRYDARLAEADQLCVAFLDGYRSVASVDSTRLALWETVHVAGVVVASWTKLKLARLPNSLHLLDDQLDRIGLRPSL